MPPRRQGGRQANTNQGNTNQQQTDGRTNTTTDGRTNTDSPQTQTQTQTQTTQNPIGSIVIPNIKFSGGAHATDEEYMWDGTMDFNHQQVDLYQRITRQHQASYPQAILQASSHFPPLAQRHLNAMILSCKN